MAQRGRPNPRLSQRRGARMRKAASVHCAASVQHAVGRRDWYFPIARRSDAFQNASPLRLSIREQLEHAVQTFLHLGKVFRDLGLDLSVRIRLGRILHTVNSLGEFIDGFQEGVVVLSHECLNWCVSVGEHTAEVKAGIRQTLRCQGGPGCGWCAASLILTAATCSLLPRGRSHPNAWRNAVATTQEAIRKPLPFDAARLDKLLEESGIDVLIATSKHNVQYLLGGYRFFFFDSMDAIGVSR